MPEVLAAIGARIESWTCAARRRARRGQAVLDQNGAGFRDFAEASR